MKKELAQSLIFKNSFWGFAKNLRKPVPIKMPYLKFKVPLDRKCVLNIASGNLVVTSLA